MWNVPEIEPLEERILLSAGVDYLWMGPVEVAQAPTAVVYTSGVVSGLAADADLDGDVDLDDFVVLKNNFGRAGVGFTEGDFTGDGVVDLLDVEPLKIHWGYDAADLPITPNPAGASYIDYSHLPLFTNGPDYNDPRQGNVGDCYFLGTLAAFAYSSPEVIRQAVRSLGDGTYVVRYYKLDGSEHVLRIDGDLPTNFTYAKLTPDGETWVALMEKAWANFRYGTDAYASIAAGWPEAVFLALANRVTETDWVYNFGSNLADYLADRLDADSPVTLVSQTTDVGRIVGNHVYAVIDVEYVGADTWITVYNPWGFDGRGSDDNTADGVLRLTLGQIQDSFRLVTATA